MQYVEYIQTDGYCWFDTGIIPNINTRVEVDKITPIQEGGSYCCEGYVGAQNRDDSFDTFQIRQQGTYTENKMWLRVGGTQISPPMTALTWTNVSLDKDNFTANGETFNVGATRYDTCNYTLYISAIHNPQWNNSTERYRASASQIGRVKVYQSGVLVGDFVPAIDDNNNIGYYDEVSQTFKANLGTGTPVAGPLLSSINAFASKTVLAATGETINIVVNCENAWEVSGNTWLTLSSTGDTSGTIITATAPSYTGTTARTDTLTFTDSVTGDEAEITIKQKKYTSGQPFYLGADEINEIYLGIDTITEAYLGDVLVFSSNAPAPTPTGGTRTIAISSIPIPPFGSDGNVGQTDIYIEDEDQNYASLSLSYSDPLDSSSYEENVDATQSFSASYASGYFEVEGEWGDDITITYSYTDGVCAGVPTGYDTEQPTFEDGVISTSFPTPESDPECECTNAGGEWDDINQECNYPEPDPCEGMGEEECECVSNGGTWVVPEIGDPYCEQGGGEDCGGDPECECVSNGGEWDSENQECNYPE